MLNIENICYLVRTQDSVEAVRYYILSMFKSPGMKILLLDEETMPIISLVSSRHELLEHQGLLVDRWIGERERES